MGKGIARFAPLTGFLAVALGALCLVLEETWSDRPSADAPAAEITAWMTDNAWPIFITGWIWWLACVALLWWIGSLRTLLARGEGEPRRVASIAYGAGVVMVGLFALLPVPTVTGAGAAEFDDRVLTDSLTETLFVMGNGAGFFLAVEIAGAALVLATAIVTLRSGVLPKWYGWLGSLYALWLLILPIGWIGAFGFWIWILLTAFLVWRAESSAKPTATAATAT